MKTMAIITASTVLFDIFYFFWYKKLPRPKVYYADKYASWTLKSYHWVHFHLSYRWAVAKKYKLPSRSRSARLAIAIASVIPVFLISPAFTIAGIIAPPSSYGAPVVMPFPNGVNDTATWTKVTGSSAGKKILIRGAGGHPYKLETVVLPAETFIEGENGGSIEIEFIGKESSLFQCGGVSKFKNLFVFAKEEQTKEGTGAFDLSHKNCNNMMFSEIQFGNNFFNGVYAVAEAGLESFGVLFFEKIEFQSTLGRAKGYKGAGFQLGGRKKTEKRTIGVWFTDIYIGGNTPATFNAGLNIRNTDSLHLKGMLIQNAGFGIRFGEEDESVLTTTNTFMSNVQCDGCGNGFLVGNLNERHQWYGISAEACEESGIAQLGVCGGLNISGSTFGVNKNGFVCKTSSHTTIANNTFNNCNFVCNTEAGILFETSTGGWQFNGGKCGNLELSGGTKKQAFGFITLTKCENIHFNTMEFVKGPKAGEEQTNYTVSAENVNVDTEAEAKTKGCIFR